MAARTDATRVSSQHAALVILDLISDFAFPDGPSLARAARQVAKRIARLSDYARAAGLPVIHVNDFAGHWNADRTSHLARCLAPEATGRSVAKLLEPRAEDHFLFKPRHSAFFATPLEDLLKTLAVQTLILTGATSHQCVLFTAMDAHLRAFRLYVPRDCIVAPESAHTRHALYILEQSMGARTPLASSLRFNRLRA